LILVNPIAAFFPRLACVIGDNAMIGITLSSEQIRNAPPDVRHWIEHQVLAELGLGAETPPAPVQSAHLAALTVEEAARLLAAIEDVLPAVNVLFEFGRPGIALGQPPVMQVRLMDILHHTRLQNVSQVMTCLETIDAALAEISRDPSVRFCGFDNVGHCLVTPETQRAIATLWQSVIAKQPGVAEGKAA
jgi:hypothetical protein